MEPMRDFMALILHFLTTLARLLGPGGTRAVIAETLLIKHQLVILIRSRRRAPNLTAADRIVMGLCTLFMNPSRIRKVAAALKPSTLLAFHRALKKRKYRRLFSPQHRGKPGPKGPSKDLVEAILEMKRRNSRYGCPRIAQQLWLANLRILEINEVKTVPYTPISHPFVERLIGSVRRELLDQVFFWNSVDLERKLGCYRLYFNHSRTHASLDGNTPADRSDNVVTHPAALRNFTWEKHCGGLFELPVAA
jgi:hypothetical protein